jgi:hypothetical protein
MEDFPESAFALASLSHHFSPYSLQEFFNKKPSVGGNAGFDRIETTVRGVTVVRVKR